MEKISVFCDHIETIAAQEGISFAEAAASVREMGYSGADVRVFQDPSEIRILDSLGFSHACAIADIEYSEGSQEALEERTLEFMEEHGYSTLLLVPGLMPEGSTREDRAAVRNRISAFVGKAAAQGRDVLVEDYDNPRSLCYDSALLDTLFQGSEKLGLVFDTGNFLYCGEDALENLDRFAGRIRHVHLKDRKGAGDMTCAPAGSGCIPVREIMERLDGSGYDGWYTVEQYGSRRMLEDMKTAYDNVHGILQDMKKR